MSQHEHERKTLDHLLSRTIEAEKFSLDPSKAVHLELLIGHIWHNAYMEKKRLDRQGRTEAQSQGRLLYRGSIVSATENAASLKRALPNVLALQAKLREIRETIKDAIRAIQNLESDRRLSGAVAVSVATISRCLPARVTIVTSITQNNLRPYTVCSGMCRY